MILYTKSQVPGRKERVKEGREGERERGRVGGRKTTSPVELKGQFFSRRQKVLFM